MTPIDLLQPDSQSTNASATHPQTPDVRAKLVALRSHLAAHQLDAYYIPSADEHLNEYLPEAKQRRNWISEFSGSAGDFLVGREQAWLFVDSRYYEQADREVDSAQMQIVKVGLEGHLTLEETLEELGRTAIKTGREFRLGYDPFTLAISQFRAFEKALEPCGVTLVSVPQNLVDQVRKQQPWATTEPIPDFANSQLFYLPEELAWEGIAKKLERVREAMQKSGVDLLPITKLDQIAWLFNLRGWDVPYNPVFIAYALLTRSQAFLFTASDRIPADLKPILEDHLTLLPYDRYAETYKAQVQPTTRVLLDPKHTTMGSYELLQDSAGQKRCKISETTSPIEGMKARKNSTELEQMQRANLKASRAKTLTLKWVLEQNAAGIPLSEADVATTVERHYAEQDGFQGLSFNTIAGTGSNSSIVHYGTPNPQQALKSGDLLLLDSGAQYRSGTTDDTRTIAIGEPTPEQIECYTEVLKAHINCAMQRFPKGTTGAQLDGITRSAMWHAGLDFGHGTGHGVGAFLNVHEGPNGISKRVSEPLELGMITSIEPGYYKSGWGGIRIENLYVVKAAPERASESAVNSDATDNHPDSKQPQTPWYYFESLTYIPFDNRLIDLNRLDTRQRQWLEDYYQALCDRLAPLLSDAENAWLQSNCMLQ